MQNKNYKSRYKQVIKLLDAETRRERFDMFDNFVEVAALAISVQCDPVHREERMKRLSALAIECGTAVMERFQQAYTIIGELALSYFDDGELMDIMGYLFFLCGLSEEGQVFTPPDVTRLMAQIAFIHKGGYKKQGYMDLYDAALGSGGTLLAGAELLMRGGHNINRDFVLCGNDVDVRCVHMAYVQFSIYGFPAAFCQGNTITLDEYSKWWTPMYVKGEWVMRKPFAMKSGPNRLDQLLKIATVPYYGVMLEAQQLLCGTENNDKGKEQ